MQTSILFAACAFAAATPFAFGEIPVNNESFLAPIRAEAARNHPSVEAARLKARAAGRARRGADGQFDVRQRQD